jgi:hypothetical protein
MTAADKTIAKALAEYEAQHDFARQVTLPWEDRPIYMGWQGGYRWFRSPNVIDLVKVRLIRSRSV